MLSANHLDYMITDLALYRFYTSTDVYKRQLITSASTEPKITLNNGFWKIRQIKLTTIEIAVMINKT